jgi:limonene-1,2-epoxide hydrolase
MTDSTPRAVQIAQAYHRAWADRDLDQVMSYVAEDIICDAPAGRIEGADEYRAFLRPFFKLLKRVELMAHFGDEESAVLMYDTVTLLAASGPACEYITVEDGEINYIRLIFDRAPFQAMAQAAA